MAVIRKVKPLGEILVEKRVLTQGQLDEALVVGKRTNTRVGNVIVKLGYATEKDIAAGLADQYQLPFVMLSTTTIPTKTVKLIPESVARRYMVIPVSVEADTLSVAMIDPLNVFAIDELRRITGLQIKPVVSTEAEITRAINIITRWRYPLRT